MPSVSADLFTFTQSATAIAKAIRSGAPVTTAAGGRAWPNSSQDKKVMVRFDWGENTVVQDTDGKYYRRVNLQINSNAENKTIADLAAGTKSHTKRATIAVETDASGNVVATESVLADGIRSNLIEDMSKNGL